MFHLPSFGVLTNPLTLASGSYPTGALCHCATFDWQVRAIYQLTTTQIKLQGDVTLSNTSTRVARNKGFPEVIFHTYQTSTCSLILLYNPHLSPGPSNSPKVQSVDTLFSVATGLIQVVTKAWTLVDTTPRKSERVVFERAVSSSSSCSLLGHTCYTDLFHYPWYTSAVNWEIAEEYFKNKTSNSEPLSKLRQCAKALLKWPRQLVTFSSKHISAEI